MYKIVDCTLRDGGYYTNWNFSDDFVNSYLLAISRLPIEFIELGYFSNQKDNNGQYFHLNNSRLKKIKKILRKDQKVFVMINFKEINSVKDVFKLLNGTQVDGIRIAINPIDLNKFIKFFSVVSRKYKNLKIYLNLMYLSMWFTKKNLLKKILNIYANHNFIKGLWFVDSHGALIPSEVRSIFELICDLKKKNLKIGCHFHNNCGLALANSFAATEAGVDYVDLTFMGFGRGAGNAETELFLATKLNENENLQSLYLFNFLEKISTLKSLYRWGPSFAYSFAASKGFSQSEIMDLLVKKRLDTLMAFKALKIGQKKQKLQDKYKYFNLKKIKKIFSKKKEIFFIGGGKSLIDFGESFFENISKQIPIVFSGINSLVNFSKLKLKNFNYKILVLAGDEIKKMNNQNFDRLFKNLSIDFFICEKNFIPKEFFNEYKRKIVFIDSFALNPLILAAVILKKINVNKIYLSFFDGNIYTENGRLVMKETQNCLDDILKKGIKVFNVTQNYTKAPFKNIWLND